MKQHTVTFTMRVEAGAARNKAPDTWIERLAGKEKVQHFLDRMGLDSRQFVAFLGLFRTLSEREALIGSIGVSRFNISYISLFAAAIGVLPWTLLMSFTAHSRVPPVPGVGEIPESVFLLLNLFITFLFIFLIMIREAATALFNPVEASILTHIPIHGPTYAAAKITHIILAVLYLVKGLNAYPVMLEIFSLLIGMFGGARWFFPVTHLVSAYLIGLWTAFIICAFYGLMRRWMPAGVLRSISAWVHLFLFGAFFVILFLYPKVFYNSFLSGLLTAKFENTQWTWLPLAWFAEIGRMGCLGSTWRLGWHGIFSIIAGMVIIWFGFRSFSGAYLPEQAFTATGRSWRNSGVTMLSRCGTRLIFGFMGSALGTGIFLFVSKMIRRDWLFRRFVLKQTWIPSLVVIGLILSIIRSGVPSLVSGKESGVQILPHLLGLIAMALCINLPFTVFSKSSWIYLTAPINNSHEFARGIFWALWVSMAGLPHIALMLFLLQFLRWEEAIFITGFNMIVLSLYLAFETRLISELPFSNPGSESRTMINGIRIQICWLIAVLIPLMLHQALCRHLLIALLAAITLFIATSLVLRVNLRRLEKEILWRLYEKKMGSNLMFRLMD